MVIQHWKTKHGIEKTERYVEAQSFGKPYVELLFVKWQCMLGSYLGFNCNLNISFYMKTYITLNIRLKGGQQHQVRKHSGEQVVSISRRFFKWLQKDGTTRIIKHRFIWHTIYEQSVPSACVKKFRKENIEFLMKSGFFKISHKKMIIFLAIFLSKNP